MKKVLIILPHASMGGTEISALRLIKKLSDKFDFHVGFFQKEGPLLCEFENICSVIDLSVKSSHEENNTEYKGIFSIILKIMPKFLGDLIWKIVKKKKFLAQVQNWAPLSEQFDIAISYCGHAQLIEMFVAYKVNALRKIAYIHNDIRYLRRFRCLQNVIEEFDSVFAVSNSHAAQIVKFNPKLDVRVVPNIIDPEFVLSKAESNQNLPETFNLVTIARLDPKQKRVSRTVRAFKNIKNVGDRWHWTIIGDGSERLLIEKLISKYYLTENISLIGFQKNPLPYLKGADFFLLASVYEAAPLVFSEAMLLGVPIASTDTLSAREMIGKHGIVCVNNLRSIRKMIRQIIHECREFDKRIFFETPYVFPLDEICMQAAIDIEK